MMRKALKYAMEALCFVLFFSAIFILYGLSSTPTEFIYYNF